MLIDDPSHLQPSTIHLTVEDQTRLAKRLQAQLGIKQLTQRDMRVALQNLSQGLKQLSLTHSNARGWSDAFSQLAESMPNEASQPPVNFTGADLHPIVRILIEQPLPSRSVEDRKKCMAAGSLAALAVAFELQKLPEAFFAGMKQLFRSTHDGWMELCAVNFMDQAILKAWKPSASTGVVRNFRTSLEQLIGISAPSIDNYLSTSQRSTTAQRPQPTDLQAVPAVTASPNSASKHKISRLKPPDDLRPNYSMFELQRQRDCQADVVDGYRISPQWTRFSPEEFKQALGPLVDDIKKKPTSPEEWGKFTQATARMVSVFCGMSLKKCLRLPLKRKGSMHLNVAQGVLRRDMQVIAPRMDRQDRKRFHGRWLRTRLPHEIRVALQILHERNPQAKTLGEILKAEGLTYEMCQKMFNDGWPSSHLPEDTRSAMSLRPCLLDLGIHPAIVARMTGDTMTAPASDFYYMSLTEAQIHEAMSIFCVWARLTPPNPPIRNRTIGTPKALTTANFQALIGKLNQKILTARNAVTPKSSVDTVLDFHNLYTTAVALQMIWGCGARGDRIHSQTVERMLLSDQYMAFADRRVDRYSRQRIVPSTNILTATRRHYVEHLKSLSDRLAKACNPRADFVLATATGKKPRANAFVIFDKTAEGWVPRALCRKDLVRLANKLGATDLNVARHFWFSELVSQNIAQVAIDAFLGHHMNGAEPFGFGSGIAVREVADYLRPTLEQIQRSLGFEPLVGCGRQAARFLRLPEIEASRSLRPLPSVLLKRKLDAQDFLIREVVMYEQDPPSDCKTLVAHGHLNRLKHRYVNSDAVRMHPAGALLFCLITYDLVLTEPEQEALFTAAMGQGLWTVNKLVVVEATNGVRPIAQRIVSKHTVAAADGARIAHNKNDVTWATAKKDLHQLMRLLDPRWSGKDAAASLVFISRLASHWAAIEIPPGSLFGVFHKAPFIPAADLARIHYRRPLANSASIESAEVDRQSRATSGFKAVLDIVQKWGNKDLPLGGSVARSNGCSAELQAYKDATPIDEMEGLLIGLLQADLSQEPPYQRLGPSTLPEYGRGYAQFFSVCRMDGTAQLDPERLLDVYIRMGGARNFEHSCPARWQMLHICSFLNAKGLWVPAGFLTGKGKKTPALPRLPVYTSHAEIAVASEDMEHLFRNQGGTYAFAKERLELQRSVPLRASEVRYATPKDLDVSNRLLHITSTGHDHLKSDYSRGSVVLPQALAQSLGKLRERRNAMGVGADTLLFADAHLESAYAAFDAISDAIKDCIVAVTGCKQFRQHDLRAAAATDLAFNVQAVLQRICSDERLSAEAHTTKRSQKNMLDLQEPVDWLDTPVRSPRSGTTSARAYWICTTTAE